MRVLVVRPQADAERTARRLAALGHEAVIAPVLAIECTDEPPPHDFDAAILTSANAVPALASIADGARKRPVFAVGERTGSAARADGFENVRVAEGDAASLSALIRESLSPDARLLHVAGRERKGEPEASLAAAGFDVSTWVAYEAVAAERLSPCVEKLLAEMEIDAVLHYSRRSAGLMIDLADAAGVLAPFLAVAHVCLSHDVAAPLRNAGAERLSVADRPDEESLLAALDRCSTKSRLAGSRKPLSR